jgi:DNA-binding FadR family transcriptional regulator
VSRNTVRTATAILESEGFLRVTRGRGGGYIVQDPAMAADRGEELRRKPEPILNAWDYRLAVDVGAARLAAERCDDEDLKVLAGLLERIDAAQEIYQQRASLDAVRHCQALDSRFFLGIAHATHNQFMVDAVMESRRRLWTAFSSYLIKLDPKSQGRRERIFEAIERGCAEDAGQFMHQHIKAGRDLFELWLTEPEHALPALIA